MIGQPPGRHARKGELAWLDDGRARITLLITDDDGLPVGVERYLMHVEPDSTVNAEAHLARPAADQEPPDVTGQRPRQKGNA